MSNSENIKSNLPFPILPRSPGLPNYMIINEIHTKGRANASSVASELGEGAHGLLGLTLPPLHISSLRAITSYAQKIPA